MPGFGEDFYHEFCGKIIETAVEDSMNVLKKVLASFESQIDLNKIILSGRCYGSHKAAQLLDHPDHHLF